MSSNRPEGKFVVTEGIDKLVLCEGQLETDQNYLN